LNNVKTLFRKNAPYIVEYCKNYAKQYRPRNEYQSILFPGDYQEEPSREISEELKEEYRNKAKYSFILSRGNLFIDNYYLKIMRKATPIPLQLECMGYGRLSWFAEWVGNSECDYLIGVTDQEWVIMVCIKSKNIFKYRILDDETGLNKKIISVNCYKGHLFVFT
jgi:hypothetical protein